MASSRIFIKGLPPSITEADFKKHFASGGREVTDARLFANRRIGYIGYKTPEDAQAAVKYFNKTFVRMSRIGVEVARPVNESNDRRAGGRAPTAPKEKQDAPTVTGKDDSNEAMQDDPKLKEYLEVMKPKSKKRSWEDEERLQADGEKPAEDDHRVAVDAEAASDEEYEEVPRKAKRTKVEQASAERAPSENPPNEPPQTVDTTADDEAVPPTAPVSDADWARSRTSRLLGLLDDDEEEEELSKPVPRPASTASSENGEGVHTTSASLQQKTEEKKPSPPPSSVEHPEPVQAETDAEPTGVRATMRLFLRNLPYDVQEEALHAEFASYGNLEEVFISLPPCPPHFKMST